MFYNNHFKYKKKTMKYYSKIITILCVLNIVPNLYSMKEKDSNEAKEKEQTSSSSLSSSSSSSSSSDIKKAATYKSESLFYDLANIPEQMIQFKLENDKYGVKEINEQNERKETPLHGATILEYKEIVKLLITKHAYVDAQDYVGITPLHLAVFKGNFDIVKLLINANADVNKQLKNGRTPLHIAVTTENLDLVNLLMNAKNINIKAQDNEGQTPWHYAVHKLYAGIAQPLLGPKINLNAQNRASLDRRIDIEKRLSEAWASSSSPSATSSSSSSSSSSAPIITTSAPVSATSLTNSLSSSSPSSTMQYVTQNSIVVTKASKPCSKRSCWAALFGFFWGGGSQ